MVVNGASSVVTSTTQALTALMSNTQYDVQVAAICGAGDTSALSPTMSFTTLCGVAMAPYLENFDAGFSNCWTQDTADDFDWTLDAGGTPSSGTGPSDDVTGGGMAAVELPPWRIGGSPQQQQQQQAAGVIVTSAPHGVAEIDADL